MDMKIRNKIQLPFSEEAIWCIIADPATMKTWNPRITEVVRITPGPPKANAQYRIRYRLGSRESNYYAELLEYEEFFRFVMHLRGGALPKNGFIQEIYELTPNSKGILLSQLILIERGGLNLPARLMLRLRNLLGSSSAKSYLLKLKGMLETRLPQ